MFSKIVSIKCAIYRQFAPEYPVKWGGLKNHKKINRIRNLGFYLKQIGTTMSLIYMATFS